MKQKIRELISVQDAMDNLAAIASIDLENLPPLGVLKRSRLVTSEEDFSPDTVEWISGEGPETILEILELTYRAIHGHLTKLYENSEMNWENRKTQKGIEAMMTLVGESAEKMQRFFALRLGEEIEEKIAESESFKALQAFYTDRFTRKFSEEEESSKSSSIALKDFEQIKNDVDYELFYIRNEDGEPYFDAEQLKNIKLSCDFDLDPTSFEEDPLLKIRAMEDRDLHASAIQILKECQPVISDFYKQARKFENNELSNSLGMAVIALFLAANPRHLLQNTMGKSCLQYFEDFHRFLRRSLKTIEYQRLIAYAPESKDKDPRMLLYFVHALARSFFERVGGVKLESIGLIHRAMRRGEEIKQKGKQHLVKGDTVWNQFLIDDEKYRTLLAKFPNGPIFKILDLIREESEEDQVIPFDPILQENLPSRVFEVETKGKKIEILRLPSPTKQALIHKADIIDEFKAFLRSFSSEKLKRKMFLINFQDRNSWKECARSKALENLQKSAEFNQELIVLTLPKDTDFYHQTNEYLNMNQTDAFIQAFAKELSSPEENGYFFPKQLTKSELARFVDMALPAIHELFFNKKNTLTRRNREDFIEIFYQFLILKCIDMLDPHLVAFTCKDAIDTSPAALGLFYGFIKLFTSDFSDKQDPDFLRWLFYTPALFIRERAPNVERFTRSVSVLERLDGEIKDHGKEIYKAFSEFYQPQTIKSLKINPKMGLH